ncbi:L,D-transpeptidase [Streptomyces daliensis]|uniref:L,D-transpeptidase n=1 Tax=Streptomyces daliensis TaxID=299421 RepID=A0A8T4IYD0_9ACTN|nr:L,D-transpeptidase [Streptomyces daliensis]
MARSGSSAGAVVAGLTAAALAVIGFFAFQANAAQDRAESQARKPGASGSPSPGASSGTSEKERPDDALPARSGTGTRVVYSLDSERVWLVGKGDKVSRTYEVEPSSVHPAPGTYKVTSRSSHITGSDGVPVENVVRFTTVGNTTIGFSAALDGSTPKADSARKTGGIREQRKDGEALWLFAPIGTKVVVVD